MKIVIVGILDEKISWLILVCLFIALPGLGFNSWPELSVKAEETDRPTDQPSVPGRWGRGRAHLTPAAVTLAPLHTNAIGPHPHFFI